jgi:hypothetical protein
MRSRKGDTQVLWIVIGLIVVMLVLFLYLGPITKTFASTKITLDSVRSCQGLTGDLSGKPAVCGRNPDCSDILAAKNVKLADGYRWSSAGRIGCPPTSDDSKIEEQYKDNVYCCVQVPVSGYTPPEQPPTPCEMGPGQWAYLATGGVKACLGDSIKIKAGQQLTFYYMPKPEDSLCSAEVVFITKQTKDCSKVSEATMEFGTPNTFIADSYNAYKGQPGIITAEQLAALEIAKNEVGKKTITQWAHLTPSKTVTITIQP